MKLKNTQREFGLLEHDTYGSNSKPARLVQESSVIGYYEDSWDAPGSSFLWVGADHHLDREEVAELIAYMQTWLDTKRLDGAQGDKPCPR